MQRLQLVERARSKRFGRSGLTTQKILKQLDLSDQLALLPELISESHGFLHGLFAALLSELISEGHGFLNSLVAALLDVLFGESHGGVLDSSSL